MKRFLTAGIGVLALAGAPACLLGRDLTLVDDRVTQGAVVGVDSADGGAGIAADDAGHPGPDEDAGQKAPPAKPPPKEGGGQVDAGNPTPNPAEPEPVVVDPSCGAGRNDEVEPNGIRALSDALPAGVMCGSFYRPGDVDMFRFDVAANDPQRIKFGAQGDAELVIEGPGGLRVVTRTGKNLEANGAGTWQLTVTSPSGDQTQRYSIVRE